MKVYMKSVDASYQHYQKFYANFIKFEDISLDYYADGELNQRSLTHPGASEAKENINKTSGDWKNPYKEAYIWLKGELLDLMGAKDAINGKGTVETALSDLEKKKKERQTELEKMSMGKTTLKSFFKSKSTIENDITRYQREVEQMTTDLEEYRKLVNFIIIYHGNIAIDKFKSNKVAQYMRMLNNFAVREISNAHLAATLYHQLLELSDNK